MSTITVALGASIQNAIDTAVAGAVIELAAGIYTQSFTVTKPLSFTVAGGLQAEIVSNGATAVTLAAGIGGDVSFDGISLGGGSIGGADGLHVVAGADVGTLSFSNGLIRGFGGRGVFSTDGGDPVNTPSADAVAFTNVDFSNNGFGGATGAGHVKLFGHSGDASFTNVSILGMPTGALPSAKSENAIEITGSINTNGNANPAPASPPPIGIVTFDGVTVSGAFEKNPVALFHFSDLTGLAIPSLDLTGAESVWGPLFNIDGVTAATIDVSGYGITLPAGASLHTEIQGEKAGQSATPVNQTITGTTGNDGIYGKDGDDTLNGGDGDDVLLGGNKAGDFVAGEGNDSLNGGAGNDTLVGGIGDDVLEGGPGNDSLDGGDGTDVAVIGDGGGVAPDLSLYGLGALSVTDGVVSGTLIGPAGTDQLSGIEVLEVANTGSSTFVVLAGMSLQAAIDAAADGDVITVAAGTYAGNLTIDKDVTILGPNAGVAGNGARGAEAVIVGRVNVTADGDGATLDGLTLSGTTAPFDWDGVNLQVQTGADDVTIQNNVILAFSAAGGFADSGYVSLNGGNVTFADNAVSADASFASPELDSRGANAVKVQIDGAATATITGNVISDAAGGGVGIVPTGATVVVDGNTISNVGEGAFGFGDAFGTLTFSNNDISGYLRNGLFVPGVSSATTGSVEIFGNTVSGPNAVTLDADVPVATTAGGTAAVLDVAGAEALALANSLGAGFVVFAGGTTSFVADAAAAEALALTDAAAATVFDLVNDRWTVFDGMSIEVAVGAASAGDVIVVSAGTYAEQVTIDKSLTLLGANAGVNAVTGTRGAETLVTGAAQFDIQADGVVIDGFQFDAIAGAPIGIGQAFNDFTLTNNIITDFAGAMGRDYYFANGFDPLNPPTVQTGWVISNNLIGGMTEVGAQRSAFYLTGLTGADITGNEFFDTQWGALQLTHVHDLDIDGNTFRDITDKRGYFVQLDIMSSDVRFTNNTTSNTAGGFKIFSSGTGRTHTNILVENNVMADVVPTGTQDGLNTNNEALVWVISRGLGTWVDGLVVRNNTFNQDLGVIGDDMQLISLNGQLRNTEITGNTFALTGVATDPAELIKLGGGLETVLVSGNTATSTATGGFGETGVLLTPDLVAAGFTSNATYGTFNAATVITVSGNSFDGFERIGGIEGGQPLMGATVTGAPNTLNGDAGGAVLSGFEGTALPDAINGGLGADFLSGGGGDDTLDGGAETDTAVYLGASTEYDIVTVTDPVTGAITGFASVTDTNPGNGDEGADALTSVEALFFAGDGVTFAVGDPVVVTTTGGDFVGSFGTIQAAVDAAGAGDVITVAAGTYAENLVIDKPLTLLGAQAGVAATGAARAGGESVLAGTGTFGVTIRADGVTLDGFEISGFGRDAINVRTLEDAKPSDAAIGAYRADVTIANTWIHDAAPSGARNGVLLGEFSGDPARSTETAEIAGFQMTGNVIDLASANARAVALTNHFSFVTLAGAQITGNTLDAPTAFFGSAGPNTFRIEGATLSGNTVVGTFNSYNFFDSSITGNTFTGIALFGVDNSTIDGNTFNTVDFYGLGLWGSEFGANVSQNSTVSNNVFNYNLGPTTASYSAGIAVRPGVDVASIGFDANTFNDAGAASVPATDVILRGLPGDDVLAVTDITDSLGVPVAVSVQLLGNAGDDRLIGGVGNDFFDGGAGTDVAVVADNLVGGAPTPFDWAAFDVSGLTVTGGEVSGELVGPDGTETLAGIEVLEVANTGSSTFVVLPGMSIQAAVDAAAAGDVIFLAAGAHAGPVTIDKPLTLLGEGSGSTTLAVASGTAITLAAGVNGAVVVEGLALDGQGTASAGVSAAVGAAAALTMTDVDASGFATWAVFSSDDGVPATPGLTALTIESSSFSNNGFGGANGAGHIKLFGFEGTASFTGVSIVGADALVPLAQRPDNAIEITGAINSLASANPAPATSPALNAAFDGVTVSGTFHKNAVGLFHFDDVSGLSIPGLDLSGVVRTGVSGEWQPFFNIDGVTAATIDASGYVIALPVPVAGVPQIELQGEKSANQGGPFDQAITGTAAQDLLNGKEGDDTLDGGAGDDVLFGGLGADSLVGGDGTDAAVYLGASTEYDIVAVTDPVTGAITGFSAVTDAEPGNGDEGVDALTSVEALVFVGDGVTFAVGDPVVVRTSGGDFVGSFGTIGAAIDAASAGDTILVAAGTYREQLTIDGKDGLTIVGAGDATVIEMVDAPAANANGGQSVVAILNAEDVTLRDVLVDGRSLGSSVAYYGVYFRNASGTVEDATVTQIRAPLQGDGTPQGSQIGRAIFADNADGAARTLNVIDNTVTGFQKTGVDLRGAGLTVAVTGNVIEGAGFLPAPNAIAQNGISLVFGPTGVISGNAISEIGYLRGDFTPTGILGFDAGDGVQVTDNVITGPLDSLGAVIPSTFNAINFSAGEADDVEITGNQIRGALDGIRVSGNSDGPTISGNVFTDMVGSVLTNTGQGVVTGEHVDYDGGANDAAVTLAGSDGPDELTGSAFADDLEGGAGDDTLEGGLGDDTLDGGSGDDSLEGGDGADRIVFGGGDDAAAGGVGDDVYVYVSGDVTITELPGEGADSIQLPAGIGAGDLSFVNDGADLVITVGALGTIRLVDQADRSGRVETLVLDGGATTISINDNPDALDDDLGVYADEGAVPPIPTNFALLLNDVAPILGPSPTPSAKFAELTVIAVNGSAAATTIPGVGTFSPGVGGFDASVNFTPVADFFGAVSFTYTVQDSLGRQDTATVTFTVANVNDAPVATAASETTDQNNTLNLTEALLLDHVTDVDVDGGFTAGPGDTPPTDVLTITSVSAPGAGDGTVIIVGGEFVFDPGADFDDLDDGESRDVVLTYDVSDQVGPTPGTASSTVTITVTGVNDAPVLADAAVTADENQTAVTTVVGSDVDVEALTYALVSGAGDNGFFAITAGGVLTFQPAPDFEMRQDGNGDGVYLAVVEVSDGDATDTATISVTVTDVNDAPVAEDDAATTDEDTGASGDVLANDADEDAGDGPSGVALMVSEAGGVVVASGGSVTVSGSDGGTFTINSDGSWDFAPGGDFQDMAVDDADRVTTVSYTASDDEGLTDTATLSVTVTAVNDAPDAVDDTGAGFVTDEETAFTTGNVLANDVEIDANDVLTVSAIDTSGTAGLVSILDAAAGTFSYDPNGQFEGLGAGEFDTDTFSYTVSDEEGATDTATVTITVNGVNDTPTGVDDTATADEDGVTVASGNVLTNDVDPDDSAVLSVVSAAGSAVASGVSLTVAGSTGGVFTIASDGAWSFDPDGAFEDLAPGEPRVTEVVYALEDEQGAGSTATLSVTVTGVNDLPVAVGDAATTAEDAAVTITVLGNDSDVDASQTLTIAALGTGLDAPANGVAAIVGGQIVYTPDPDFNGTDSFTYTISDDAGATATATVDVTVTPVNDDPVPGAPSATYSEDDTGRFVDLLDGATDVDLDPLSVSGVTVTAVGGDPASVAFTQSGAGDRILDLGDGQFDALDLGDTLTLTVNYDVSDGTVDVPASAEIVILGANDLPEITSPATFTPDENQTVVGTVTATDVDADDTRTFAITGGADETDFVIVAGTGELSFVAAPNFEAKAAYEVEVTVTDSRGATDVQTISVNVQDVNDAPVAGLETRITTEDQALFLTPAQVLADDLDEDGDLISFVGVVSGTEVGGTVAFNGSQITFTPTLDFNGAASFEYTLSDGTATATGTVNVTVTPVPDAPVAGDDAFSVNEDDTLSGALLGNDTDADDDVLSVTAVNGTPGLGVIALANGTLTLAADGTFTYAPDADFAGVETFDYTVSDGALSDVASVTITVDPVEDAPRAEDDAATTDEDAAVTIDVLANDAEVDAGQELEITAVGGASNGTVFIDDKGTTDTTDDEIVYTPSADFNGTDSFTYTVSDGALTDTATVNVTVTPVNDAPVAADDSGTVAEDGSVTIAVLGNDTDADGIGDIDAGSVLIDDGGAGVTSLVVAEGAWSVTAAGAIVFTPGPDVDVSPAPIAYTVADLSGARSNPAQVTVTVTPANDAPTLTGPTSFAVSENVAAVTTVAAADPDTGETLTFSILPGGDAAAFDIDPTTGALSFDPAPDFENPTDVGGDNFYEVVVQVADSGSLTDTATITVEVLDGNDAPVAVDDFITGVEDNPVAVPEAFMLLNDDDEDVGSSLNVVAVAAGTGGTPVLDANGNVSFVPTPGFNGQATFTYTVSDGTLTDTAEVTIDIAAVPDLPVAVDDPLATTEGATVTGDVLANDSDQDGDALSVSAVAGGPVGVAVAGDGGGLFTIAANGAVTFDPNGEFEDLDAGATATTSVVYTLLAGGDTDTATVTATVTGEADAPVGGSVSLGGLDEDTAFARTVVDTASPGAGEIALSALATDVDSALTPGSLSLASVTVDGAPVALGASGVSYDPLTGAFAFDPTGVALFQALDTGDVAEVVAGFDVTDGALGATASITLSVAGVNDAPVVTSGAAFSVAENGAAVGTVTAEDVDDAGLTFSLGAEVDAGAFTIDASTGALGFVTAPDFEAAGDANLDNVYEFSVEVSDGEATTVQAVTVTVTDVPEAPTLAGDLALEVDEGASVTLTVADLSAEDDEDGPADLTYAVTAAPAAGRLELAGAPGVAIAAFTQAQLAAGEVSYVHDGSEPAGPDAFTVEVADTDAQTAGPVTVTVAVTAVNDAPVGVADAYAVGFETPLVVPVGDGVLFNDTDEEGDALTAALVAGPANGTLTLNLDGSFEYTPNVGFSGTDSFTYAPTDAAAGAATTVTLTVASAVTAGPGDAQLTGAADVFVTSDAGSNRIVAGDGDDAVLTGGGADTLVGGAGGDNLNGGAGDDVLIGGAGNDELTGGTGADVFVIDAADFVAGGFDTITDFQSGVDVIEVSGFAPADVVVFEAGGGVGLRLEDGSGGLIGGVSLSGFTSAAQLAPGDIQIVAAPRSFAFDVPPAAITLTGDADNFVTSDAGPNVIEGGDGADFISAGAGADLVTGGAGSDVLAGVAGDDTLDGGSGADLLTGGSGADTFRFRFDDLAGVTLDTVTDFAPGEDVLEFVGFAGLGFGDLSFTDLGADLLVSVGGSGQLVRLNGVADATEISSGDVLFA